MRKRLFSCAIVVALVLGCLAQTAFADEGRSSRASDYLDSYGVGMNNIGGRTMEVYYRVYGTRTMDELGVSKIVVWENDGFGWEEYGTYTSANNSDFYANNTSEHSGGLTFIGLPGCDYKATVTVYAKRGSGSDSRTVTTSIGTC